MVVCSYNGILCSYEKNIRVTNHTRTQRKSQTQCKAKAARYQQTRLHESISIEFNGQKSSTQQKPGEWLPHLVRQGKVVVMGERRQDGTF